MLGRSIRKDVFIEEIDFSLALDNTNEEEEGFSRLFGLETPIAFVQRLFSRVQIMIEGGIFVIMELMRAGAGLTENESTSLG